MPEPNRAPHDLDECKCGCARRSHAYHGNRPCQTVDTTNAFGVPWVIACPCKRFRLKREFEQE